MSQPTHHPGAVASQRQFDVSDPAVGTQRPYQGEERIQEDRETARLLGGGSTMESLAGAGAVTLAVVGLAGVVPTYLLSIATIAVGAGLVLEGSAIASRASDLVHRFSDQREQVDLAGGMTVEFLGGAAGIVLGILSLIQLSPLVLTPVAALVFGGTLILSAKGRQDLNRVIATSGSAHPQYQHAMYQAAQAGAGARALVGIGSAALGVLVLAGVGAPLTLTLIAMLACGASLMLSGATLAGRLAPALRQH